MTHTEKHIRKWLKKRKLRFKKLATKERGDGGTNDRHANRKWSIMKRQKLGHPAKSKW